MMSDLSNTLRNMKFMQRTSESRKKLTKKPSQIIPVIPTAPIITMPEHPGCWRIIKNEFTPDSQTTALNNSNHPSITYRPSIFSIHDRTYTRLSFQNYNKRIEPLMIKYGLKQDLNNLEDGEIDPDDDQDEDNNNNNNKESKYVSTLSKSMKKKFQKKSFSRVQFDNKSRVTKRRRRTRHENSTN